MSNQTGLAELEEALAFAYPYFKALLPPAADDNFWVAWLVLYPEPPAAKTQEECLRYSKRAAW